MVSIRKPLAIVSFLAGLGSLSLSGNPVLFDAQSYNVIVGSGTTAPGAIAWNALGSPPGNFNTFSPISSASVTNGGLTLELTNMIGSWSGNSAFIVSQRPLENDYFVIATGTTGILTISGLFADAEYYLLVYHGRAEPGQLRQLTVSSGGVRYGGWTTSPPAVPGTWSA